jgi:uncharacterized protein YukE
MVNITSQMMTNASNAIDEYRKKTEGYHTELTDTVNTLIPGSFSGAAAEGFQHFYTNSIEPAIGTDLTELLKSLENIVDETLKALPGGNGLDDQLGEGNRQ